MENAELLGVIEKFKGKRIAVVGDVMLDKYIYGRVERVNPESPAVPLLKIERKEFRLGGAANVALNLTALGAKVDLFCVVGDDYYGVLFEDLCKEKGINLRSVRSGQSIVKERAIESEFNKYLIRADDGELDLKAIDPISERKLLDKLESNGFDTIVLSDYNKRLFRKDFGSKVIGSAKLKGIPSVVDPKPVNIDSFKLSTVLCPNIKEAREIVGSNDDDEREIARKIREMVDSEYIVVTCGSKGIVGYDGEKFIESITKSREIVDVTGAGDTVTSLVALGLACGLDLESATHLANYGAGVVVGKKGTATLSREELIEMIKTDGIL